jgi:hypothetical protein
MIRTQAITPTQQRAIVRLAKRQGCSCIECGSSDYLESDTKAVQSSNYMNVGLFCKNPDASHPNGVLALGKSFPLTFEQAEAIGIVGPSSVSVPRLRPGEISPR